MSARSTWLGLRAIAAALLLVGCAVDAASDPPLHQPRPTFSDVVAAMDEHRPDEPIEFLAGGALYWGEVPWKSEWAELHEPEWTVHHKAPGAEDVSHGWVYYVDLGRPHAGQENRRKVERTYLFVFRDGLLQSVVDTEPRAEPF